MYLKIATKCISIYSVTSQIASQLVTPFRHPLRLVCKCRTPTLLLLCFYSLQLHKLLQLFYSRRAFRNLFAVVRAAVAFSNFRESIAAFFADWVKIQVIRGVGCYTHVRVLGLRMAKYLQTANERQNERQRERERQAGRAFCKKDGKLEEAQKQTDFRLIHPPKMNT